MESCDLAVSAQINGKEQPNTLYVHGSMLSYSAADEVVVVEAIPQGINPRILILDASIKQLPGPMKGTCLKFLFTKEVDGRQYDKVMIRREDGQTDSVVVSYAG